MSVLSKFGAIPVREHIRQTTAFVTPYKANGRAWEGWGRISDGLTNYYKNDRVKSWGK